MKILLHDDTPAYLCHGGKQVLAQRLYEALSAIGANVEYARWWDPNQHCDLIHTFGCPSEMIAMAHEAGVRVVYTHLVDYTTNKPWSKRTYCFARNRVLRRCLPRSIHQLLPWHVFPFADALIYVIREDAETAINAFGIASEKVYIIPVGCDSDQMKRLASGPSAERSYLVSVASIVPRKNNVLLARVARAAGVPVVFIGKPFSQETPYFKEFVKLVDGSSVIYRGYVTEEEKIHYLTGASGFALLSTAESGCIAVHEAAAARLPLFLSCLPWAVAYGRRPSIQLVDVGDEVALAGQLRTFFANSRRLDAPTFPVQTWEEVARQHMQTYARVLSMRPRSGNGAGVSPC